MSSKQSSKRSTRTLASFLVFGMASVGPCQFALAQSGPTQSECNSAWSSSSASDSCGLHQVHDNLATVTVSGGQCSVHVDCSTSHWGQHRENNWSGSKEDMANLSNCNGDLTVGSC